MLCTTSNGMINIQLFKLINSWATKNYWLDQLMIFSAEWLGYVLIALLVGAFLMNRGKYWDMVVVSLGSAIVARFVFVEIIRFFYNNPRPFLVLQNVHQLISKDMEPSFPSGHASFYFALATGVYFYNKKAGYIYFVLAGLMGFARIFVGVHWPADIVAGAILGLLTAVVVRFIKQKMPQKASVDILS